MDRFHLTGHNCCNIYNGDLQNTLDGDRSVAAEVINSVINKGASHINYLYGKNVIPFMKVVFAHVNATAVLRDNVGRDDVEDDDAAMNFAQHFKCSCLSCCPEVGNNGPITEDAMPVLDGVGLFGTDNISRELY